MNPNVAFLTAIYVLCLFAAGAVVVLACCIERRLPWPLKIVALVAFGAGLAALAEAPSWSERVSVLHPVGYVEIDTGCWVDTITQERKC